MPTRQRTAPDPDQRSTSATKKTHADSNNKLFKKLDHVNSSLYGVELAKAPAEQGAICFRYLHSSDVNKFEELELYTDSLYLAFAETYLEDCIRPEKKQSRNGCGQKIALTISLLMRPETFPSECALTSTKNYDDRETGLFKEEIRCTEMLCIYSKTYCCYDVALNMLKFSSKDLTERVLERSGDGLFDKYYTILDEKTNITSANRGFRTNNYTVATYEQIKKGLSLFMQKKCAEGWMSHSTSQFMK